MSIAGGKFPMKEKKKNDIIDSIFYGFVYVVIIANLVISIQEKDRAMFKFCVFFLVLLVTGSAVKAIHEKLDEIIKKLDELKKERDE